MAIVGEVFTEESTTTQRHQGPGNGPHVQDSSALALSPAPALVPPPTSVNPDAVTVAVRTYLDGRFSAERAQIDIWKSRNYGTTYLSFLQHRLLMIICTQHLSIVFSSRRIHSVNTDDGHPFTWKEVVEWAGIKWKAFAEMRTLWKRAEDTLMLLRQENASGGSHTPLDYDSQRERNRLFRILDIMFTNDVTKVHPPIDQVLVQMHWVRDAVSINRTEMNRLLEYGPGVLATETRYVRLHYGVVDWT